MAAIETAASCSHVTYPGRVLLVDDEPELRRLLRRSLSRAGFEVVEASHGRAALELARQSSFDVVISDVRMPCMGGLELLERLQLEEPSLPVVLMSGSDELRNQQTAFDVGAFDYLPKPIKLADIQSVALAAIARRRELEASGHEPDGRESFQRLRSAVAVAATGSVR